MPIVIYELIEENFPSGEKNIIENLSTDQKHLWDINDAICSGEFSSNLASRSPRKLSHARWLTLAITIDLINWQKCNVTEPPLTNPLPN